MCVLLMSDGSLVNKHRAEVFTHAPEDQRMGRGEAGQGNLTTKTGTLEMLRSGAVCLV